MQVVDEPIETIHLYVVKEQEKCPSKLPLLFTCLFLAALVGAGMYFIHPYPVHETLTLPATFLPLQTFSATEQIIPTGVKFFPATTAHGVLTLTNGSVITEELPGGMIFSGKHSEVQTDEAVTVPPGNADGYGVATVSAHAVQSGIQGNIPPHVINQVYGTSLFIRNLSAFKGGQDAYTVKIVTQQDKQTAFSAAKVSVTSQEARIHAILATPCKESVSWSQKVQLTWICQFVAYPTLPGKIISIRFVGKQVIVEVLIVVQPRRVTK